MTAPDTELLKQPANNSISDNHIFLFAMLSTTIFPILFFPLFHHIRSTVLVVDNVFSMLLILSTMHVALTLYFYIDRDYRKHIASFRDFYIVLPIAIIALCGSIGYLFGSLGIAYIFVFYHTWLLFHYGRQNFGLLSFISIGFGGGHPDLPARIALHVAPIGGILAAHRLLPEFQLTILSPLGSYSIWAGIALQVLAIGCALYSCLVSSALISWRNAFLTIASLFYLPTFIFDSYATAVLGYAVAHALQYTFFMYFLASGVDSGRRNRSIIGLMLVGVLGVVALWIIREKSFWGPDGYAMAGISFGAVMWHFIVDAGVWRLRDTWQRQQVRDRFQFLFARRP